jgi:propanol-preferring alcohol dehydrogenase
MKAMVLHEICPLRENKTPLKLEDVPIPVPEENEILIKISCCGVCHTEIDEIEGRTPPLFFPIILGHQAVGRVENTGKKTTRFQSGDRVGVAWIFSSCGKCEFCLNGLENLCSDFKATGRDANGGYAQYMTVPEDFAHPIPETFSDLEAAPLLCAGAIGWRSLKLAKIANGDNVGLAGFGASAHLVCKIIKYKYPDSKIFVFSRTETEKKFAMELGAFWAGDFELETPEKLNCIIDTTPVWKPVVDTLKNLEEGGRFIINAVRKEDVDKEYLTKLVYSRDLWMEKELKSVANVTRDDVTEFLVLAAKIPIKPEVEEFRLEDANRALIEIKERKIRGAKVLKI